MSEREVPNQPIRAEEVVRGLTRQRGPEEKPVYRMSGKQIEGELDLKHRTIEVAVDIQNCEFLDEVDLRYCEFKQAVYFSDCRFRGRFNSGDEDEARTIYHKDLNCMRSVFEGPFDLNGGVVEGSAYFSEAKFLNEERSIELAGTSVGGSVECTGTFFKGETSFNGLKCGGAAFFGPATSEEESKPTIFEKEADFGAATFGRHLACRGATFKGEANFNSINCGDSAFFESATSEEEPKPTIFEKEADFGAATFGRQLACQGATFTGNANFSSINCGITASFDSATFEGEADFGFATFGATLTCNDATFTGPVSLEAIAVSQDLQIVGASLQRYVLLYKSQIGLLNVGDTLPFGEHSQLDLRECRFDTFNGDPSVAREMAAKQPPEVFSRDPYLQLEKYYHGAGNDLEAKRMHYTGRNELR